jgi:hypothetical protein
MSATAAAVATTTTAAAAAGISRYDERSRRQDAGRGCRDQSSFHVTPPRASVCRCLMKQFYIENVSALNH